MLVFVSIWKTLNRGLSTKGKGPDVGMYSSHFLCVY